MGSGGDVGRRGKARGVLNSINSSQFICSPLAEDVGKANQENTAPDHREQVQVQAGGPGWGGQVGR